VFEIIGFILIAAGYISGYIVSRYSLAVYVDPDDLNALVPDVSERQREFLRTLAENPRASLQVATVFKSFQLVVISVVAGLLLQELAVESDLTVYLLFPLGFGIVWLLQILFVEFLPRRRSRSGVRLAMLRHLWLIRLVHFLFLPVVGGYHWVLRRGDEEPVSEEEKEDIIERAIETLAEQAGIEEQLVEEDEKRMIGRIFLLDQTVVREIMIPRIEITGIEQNMSLQDIQQLVLDDGHSRFPVFEETIDRFVGVLYVKDLFSNMPASEEEFNIKNYLRKPFVVPESKIIGDLLREFKIRRKHIALVVDEYGGLAGLVTLEDILEEIVGDIQDEHDTEQPEILRLADGNYAVDASVLVSDLQDVLGTEHKQGDYDTVGGLMYDLYGSVPPAGERLVWNDLSFEIAEVEGQRIKSVRVRAPRSAHRVDPGANGVGE
jgi:CBS domain containing-hemolysin-like protein